MTSRASSRSLVGESPATIAKWAAGVGAIALGCGTAAAVQPILLLLLGAAVGAAAWARFAYRRPVAAFTVIVGMIVFSSHVFALANQAGVPAGMIRSAIAVKDVLAWLLLAALIIRAVGQRRPLPVVWPLLLVAGTSAAYLVLGDSYMPLAAQVQSIRGATVAVLALATVALLDPEERRRVAGALVHVVGLGAIYALIELTMPASFVKDVIGVGNYWMDVKEVPRFIDPATGLPGNFFTTQDFPRLSGAFGDPLSAGQVIAVALVLAIAYRASVKHARILIPVLAVALALTFTRNGWLLAALAFVAFSIRRYGLGGTCARLLGVTAAVTAAMQLVEPLNVYISGVLSGTDSSTLGHQQALEESLDTPFSFIGAGWATGGSWAANFNADAVSSESAYVAVAAQVGIIGGLFFLLALFILCRTVLAGQPMAIAGAAIVAALLVSAAISENILTFNAGFLPVAGIGLVAAAPATLRREKPVRRASRPHRVRGRDLTAAYLASSI